MEKGTEVVFYDLHKHICMSVNSQMWFDWSICNHFSQKCIYNACSNLKCNLRHLSDLFFFFVFFWTMFTLCILCFETGIHPYTYCNIRSVHRLYKSDVTFFSNFFFCKKKTSTTLLEPPLFVSFLSLLQSTPTFFKNPFLFYLFYEHFQITC
jgi:hypothetical protein